MNLSTSQKTLAVKVSYREGMFHAVAENPWADDRAAIFAVQAYNIDALKRHFPGTLASEIRRLYDPECKTVAVVWDIPSEVLASGRQNGKQNFTNAHIDALNAG